MADDQEVETLRLRAKAKAKANQARTVQTERPVDPFVATQNRVQSAENQIGTNPVAGAMNLANAKVQEAFGMPNMAANLIRQNVPAGGVAVDISSIPANILSFLGQNLAKAGMGYAGLVDKNLGTGDPSKANEVRRAGTELGGNLGMFMLPSAIENTPRGVALAIDNSKLLSPERMTQKAFKFTGSEQMRGQKINTALQEGLSPTSSSLSNFYDTIGKLDEMVSGTIKGSPKTVSTDNVLKEVQPLINKTAQSMPIAQPLIDKFGEMSDQFRAERGASIPAETAQSIKRGVYKDQKAFYERQQKTGEQPPAESSFDVAVARGIMKELEAKFPEIAAPNKRMGAMLNMQKDFEAAVRREANKPSFPNHLTAVINPKWWIAKLFIDNPALKARVARTLNDIRSAGGITKDIPQKETAPDFNAVQQ